MVALSAADVVSVSRHRRLLFSCVPGTC